MTIRVRPATPQDLPGLSSRLRQGDLQEIKSMSGLTPLEALRSGLENSMLCRVGVDEEDVPRVIYGVAPHPILPQVGCIWLLGDDVLVNEHRMSFLKQTKKYLKELEAHFPVLMNWMDARQDVHQQWLTWLGFKFIDSSTSISMDGSEFLKFIRISGV